MGAFQPTANVPTNRPGQAGQAVPDVYRVLDWTNLDSPPSTVDIARLTSLGGNGSARVAILVNTPRMLRAATALSEHAGLQGVLVRVFVDSTEAMTWLYKPLPNGVPRA